MKCLFTKKCPQYKICVGYAQGGARELKITFMCLINKGTRNLITFVLRVFLFVDKGEHFIRFAM